MANREGARWTLEETKLAFVYYFSLDQRDRLKDKPDIIELADFLGRTPDSVSMKLDNIAAFDKRRVSKGRKGLTNGGKLIPLIWEMYEEQGSESFFGVVRNSKELLVDLKLAGDYSGAAVPLPHVVTDGLPTGEDRAVVATRRVNQSYFRNSLLANYDNKCCITGVSDSRLLVASHIKPWSEADPLTERVNPQNGLLLNALHDRAFDQGLITVTPDYVIHVSRKLRHTPANDKWIRCLEGERIHLPQAHEPAKEFLEYHNDVVFVA